MAANASGMFKSILILAWFAIGVAEADPNQIAHIDPKQKLTGNNAISLGKLPLGQNFSFSVWLKPVGPSPDWAAIIDYRHKSTKSFAFHKKGGMDDLFAFGVHSRQGAHGVYTRLRPRQWQHVVLVKAPDHLRIAVDGQVVNWAKLDPNYRIDYSGDEIMMIGGWGYGGRRWIGEFSCLRVFDAVLSDREIRQLAKQKHCRGLMS